MDHFIFNKWCLTYPEWNRCRGSWILIDILGCTTGIHPAVCYRCALKPSNFLLVSYFLPVIFRFVRSPANSEWRGWCRSVRGFRGQNQAFWGGVQGVLCHLSVWEHHLHGGTTLWYKVEACSAYLSSMLQVATMFHHPSLLPFTKQNISLSVFRWGAQKCSWVVADTSKCGKHFEKLPPSQTKIDFYEGRSFWLQSLTVTFS